MASKSEKAWFFNKYQSLLKRIEEKDGLDYTEPATFIAEDMLNRVRLLGPEGYREPEKEGLRRGGLKSSERRGVPSIITSWFYRLTGSGSDVTVQLHNAAPHVKFVIHGTPGHRIPLEGDADPRLFFFWARRVNPFTNTSWGPKGPKHDPTPNWRHFFYVEHPGSPPNPFLEKAKETTVPESKPEIKETTIRWLSRIHEESGFK